MGDKRRSIGHYYQQAMIMETKSEMALPPAARMPRRALSMFVFVCLDLADFLVRRFAPPMPAIFPSSGWPWAAGATDATPAIREELDRYLAGPRLPHTVELAGYDADSAAGQNAVPIGRGSWRSLLLFVNGKWLEDTAPQFPSVVRLLKNIHPKASVGFSLLEPHSHIETHVGANRGAMRFQLPIIVPGEPGDCRIRIGDEVVKWKVGEPVFFDLATDHEAWNDTDEDRILLMVELLLPLPQPLATVNRLLQYTFRWHPSYREMPVRLQHYAEEREAVS